MQNFSNKSTASSICRMNAFEKNCFVPNESYRNGAYVVCVSICILGIVGNILAFLVLRKTKQCSITFLLKTLAITDTLCSFALLNYTINVYVYYGAWYFNSTFGCMYSAFVLTYITSPLVNITHIVTVWIAVLIGLNRYIVVCFPFYAKRLSRTAINKRVVCMIMTISFILSSSVYILTTTKPLILPNNKTCYIAVSRFNKPILQWLFLAFVDQIVVLLVPFIILLFVTVRMINSLLVARRNRNEMQVSSHKTQEHTLTQTVIAILVAFALCQSTLFSQTVVYLYKFVLRTLCKNEISHLYLHVIDPYVLTSMAINSSVNFMIYIVMNKSYRDLMLNILCNK